MTLKANDTQFKIATASVDFTAPILKYTCNTLVSQQASQA